MKLTQNQIESIVSKVFETWKKNNVVTFKEDEKKAFQRATDVIGISLRGQ